MAMLSESIIYAGGFTPEALEALCGAPLPGNIRQLRNLVQGARAAAGEAPVGVLHLPIDQLAGAVQPEPSGTGTDGHTADVNRKRPVSNASRIWPFDSF